MEIGYRRKTLSITILLFCIHVLLGRCLVGTQLRLSIWLMFNKPILSYFPHRQWRLSWDKKSSFVPVRTLLELFYAERNCVQKIKVKGTMSIGFAYFTGPFLSKSFVNVVPFTMKYARWEKYRCICACKIRQIEDGKILLSFWVLPWQGAAAFSTDLFGVDFSIFLQLAPYGVGTYRFCSAMWHHDKRAKHKLGRECNKQGKLHFLTHDLARREGDSFAVAYLAWKASKARTNSALFSRGEKKDALRAFRFQLH